LYGINSMAQLGVRAECTDDGHQPVFLDFCVNRLQQYLTKRSGFGFNLRQSLRLLPRFKRYDVLFGAVDSAALPVLALKSLGLINRPIVYQSIGLMESMRSQRTSQIFRLYRRWVNAADIVACFSWSEYDAFISLFNVPVQKMRFIMPSLDLDYFSPASAAHGDLILSAGRDRFRDYATLFQSVDGLSCSLQVVASPQNLTGLRVPDNVSVTFDIPIAELREWYRRSRFVVIAVRDNLYSAGSSVFLQAMAMERACIISATEAISKGYEFLRSGQNCIMVKPGDVKELRSAIAWLMAHPEEADRMGKAARAVVERHFNPEQYARALAEICKQAGQRTVV
jgi:glycosyltransferase involved in cell wall biosynthesis